MNDLYKKLDDLCPACNGSTWQMNADYEEVPCWHDIHDRDTKQAILDWHNKQVLAIIGEDEYSGEYSFDETPYDTIRNELRDELRQKLKVAAELKESN